MPMPSLEPMPLPSRLFLLVVPEEAHDASYFAASARIERRSLRELAICSLYVPTGDLASSIGALLYRAEWKTRELCANIGLTRAEAMRWERTGVRRISDLVMVRYHHR